MIAVWYQLFEELMKNEQNIKKILADKIPLYKKRAMPNF
jgi:hypothetical protein